MPRLNSILMFGKEGDKPLLHGILHINIIQATNIPDLDWGLSKENKTDPFVEISTDTQRLAKTRTIHDNLNPEWNETFYVQVAHYTKSLTFTVKDSDMLGTTELVGKTTLPVEELIKLDETTGRQMRVGVHKIAVLTARGKTRGHLEYFVELIPRDLSADLPVGGGSKINLRDDPQSKDSEVEAILISRSKDTADLASVPGVYFKGHEGNEVKLYVNADDSDDMAPIVRYGGPSNDKKMWKPPRLWRDIYDAICDAKHFIYITGWAVDTTQSLLRGKERDEALAKGKYSPYIGELLKQKANEGVTVNMLVWDDATSNPDIFRPVGFMGTHDEESKKFFEGSKVTFRLAPMLGGEENVLKEKLTKVVLFTHHQKIVALDAVCKEKGSSREPLAFVGGIDLTNGRWDNRHHPLFRTLGDDHKGDAYNGCFAVDADNVGPREPWHDIHSSVRGPAALDVIANFRERWAKQAPDAIGELLDLQKLGLANPPKRMSEEAWCSQVLRSIDERTAVFSKVRLMEFSPQDVSDIGGVDFKEDASAKKHTGLKGLLVAGKDKIKETGHDLVDKFRRLGTNEERTRRFNTIRVDQFAFATCLSQKKGRLIDSSMHQGWVHHIRRAKHTLYIESQYFLGSSHMWSQSDETKCGNLIPAEVTLKICDKISNGERFAAYILVPLWPEGISESASVQAILHWQKLTMESMYKRIAAALKRSGRKNESPKDFLNFYALANREIADGSEASKTPARGIEETLSKSRRHQVYVHSKMLIADDAVTIIGSANINQRSMDGARDSEIAVASYQPAHMPTEDSVPNGDVHAFRLHCWATTTNKMEDVFKDPSSLDCVHRLNAIAEANWKDFVSPEVIEMDSHLIPYPIVIDSSGHITPRQEFNGFFPDTTASIVGTMSQTLPEILTT
eukprot:CAMPEP_0172422072 /NCGR_PEP_ID=MMETSP1064-20121228/8264_1 /TAXON_ID=202472 /ORGANISM="Aulacoseira subarctica , Strain CCAP 1002/5" /LENGTH=906 /DNA_ID=CAMNT_0013162769 /DNA_START=125 /DNA_END=2845 /DNA_ORIENTATION=-